MKTFLIVIFAAVAVALGGLYVRQTARESTRAKEAQALKTELAAKAQALEQLETERKRVEANQQQLLALSDKLSTELKARQTAQTNLTAAPGETGSAATKPDRGGGLGKLIAGMMEDPGMKKMIRDQQRGMLGQMYDPLISKMSLTPEEASKFKDMIADNMAKATESAGSLFGGSSSNRTEAVQRMVADQKVLDDQIRGFLGEDRYAQYRDYQDTVGERTQLNMFKQQSEGAALTEAQTEQLLIFMKEEKQTAMAASGLPASGPGQDEAGLQAMMSEEAGNKLLESQERANQKVYERAAAVLSAEQLASFGKFQTNQTQMMRMGIGMARQFLAPEGE